VFRKGVEQGFGVYKKKRKTAREEEWVKKDGEAEGMNAVRATAKK